MSSIVIILISLITPALALADTWNCEGRSVSVVNGRNRVEVYDYAVQNNEPGTTQDTLIKAISSIETLLDQKNKIKNVCNFPAIVDPANLKTYRTWTYALKWKTKDQAPGTSSTEISNNVDNWEEFEIEVNRIAHQDQSTYFFTITTLCSYFCR